MLVSNMKERLQKFCEETTAHGVGNLVRRKTKRRQTSWWFIVITVFGITIFHLSSLLPTYLEFNYEEAITVDYSSKLPFPSVTLCNLQVILPQEYRKLVDLYVEKTYAKNPFCSPEQLPNFSTITKLNRSTGAPYMFFEYFENDIHDLSHKLKDFVVECVYSGADCSENFQLFLDPSFHNCFTFIAPTEVNQGIRFDGPYGGLSVILFVDNRKPLVTAYNEHEVMIPFSPKIPTSNAVGAHVTIHTPGTLPESAIHGFDAPVGYSTSAVLSAKYKTRLEAPYKSNCTKQTDVPGSNFSYTQEICLLHCLQEETVSKCNCLNSLTSEKFIWQNLSYCGGLHLCNFTKQGEKLKCQYNVEGKFRKENTELYNRCMNRCQLPCYEYVYTTAKSISRWPGKFYHTAFNHWIKMEKENDTLYAAFIASLNESVAQDSALIEDNFLRLNVYFEHFRVETTSQEIAYPIERLFSDIGGSLGLWVGISIVTVCEIFELIIDLLIHAFRRQTANRVSSDESNSGTVLSLQ